MQPLAERAKPFGASSNVSIYWASPVYQHKSDPLTGNFDPLTDVGIWICAHVLGLHQYSSPPNWVYNHTGLGPGMLARFRLACSTNSAG